MQSEADSDLKCKIEDKIKILFNEYGLGPLKMLGAMKWVHLSMEKDNEDLMRLRHWILNYVNGIKRVKDLSPYQNGCPTIIPNLRAFPFWDTSLFPWVKELESKFKEIKEELLSLKGQQGFQPYRSPSWSASSASPDGIGGLAHETGQWNVFYLQLHNIPFSSNCTKCQTTMSILKDIPRLYEHAFFSALSAGTHITPHNGPTNKKLRVQFPLVVPGNNCLLRAGDQTVHLQEGKVVIFDDSFEHEAWNKNDSSRIILIFDIWHPDFHDREVAFFKILQQSQLRMEKKMLEARQKVVDSGASIEAVESFYDIIEKASQISIDEDVIFS